MYKTGDIILFKPTNFMNSFIARMTESEYSHSAVIFDNIFGEPFILEIDWSKSRLVSLSSLQRDHDVYRVDSFPREIFKENIVKSGKYFNVPYDYVQLVSFWRRIFFKARITNNEDKYICSEIVDRAFYDIGVDLIENYKSGSVTPEDLAQSKLTYKVEEVRYGD